MLQTYADSRVEGNAFEGCPGTTCSSEGDVAKGDAFCTSIRAAKHCPSALPQNAVGEQQNLSAELSEQAGMTAVVAAASGGPVLPAPAAGQFEHAASDAGQPCCCAAQLADNPQLPSVLLVHYFLHLPETAQLQQPRVCLLVGMMLRKVVQPLHMQHKATSAPCCRAAGNACIAVSDILHAEM